MLDLIAIVGPTGCGKTTVINLLMRFYDVTGGKITVDGKDIRTVKRDDLRKLYGMVLQETWLKNGTIYENIAFGNHDASMEEIKKETTEVTVQKNFLEEIIENDLATGKHKSVLTRFPPEPNGYIHIGHAKAVCLDFGMAELFGGEFRERSCRPVGRAVVDGKNFGPDSVRRKKLRGHSDV